MYRFDRLGRNRLIRKLHSTAVAITIRRIGQCEGYSKTDCFTGRTEDILPLKEINIEVCRK